MLLSTSHMSDLVHKFTVHIEQVDGFDFRVRFDKEQYPELRIDEPEPLGRDHFPNPARILAAAIGDCLAASFLFCMKRQRVQVRDIRAEVEVEIVRNEDKRLRIGAIDVRLLPTLDGSELEREKCLAMFEDFCVVTQSVRAGLDVRVHVEPTS